MSLPPISNNISITNQNGSSNHIQFNSNLIYKVRDVECMQYFATICVSFT